MINPLHQLPTTKSLQPLLDEQVLELSAIKTVKVLQALHVD
jgi:hypothetical protein